MSNIIFNDLMRNLFIISFINYHSLMIRTEVGRSKLRLWFFVCQMTINYNKYEIFYLKIWYKLIIIIVITWTPSFFALRFVSLFLLFLGLPRNRDLQQGHKKPSCQLINIAQIWQRFLSWYIAQARFGPICFIAYTNSFTTHYYWLK